MGVGPKSLLDEIDLFVNCQRNIYIFGNLGQGSTNKSYFTDKTYKENTAPCKLKNLFIGSMSFAF